MAKKTTTIVAPPTVQDRLTALPHMIEGLTGALSEAVHADAELLKDGLTEDQKAETRSLGDKAKTAFKRMAAAITAGFDGVVPAAGEREFEAVHTIDHGGKRYAEGDPIMLDRDSFNQLKEAGAVLGAWPD